MISNIDIKDWQMLTTPLKLEKLKEGELFSVAGSDKVFKLMCIAQDIAFAETAEVFYAFALPRFMEVYPWQNVKS
jgi:hypothetical protein